MVGERRLEYETGPPLEDEAETDEGSTDDGDGGSTDAPGRRPLPVSPWTAGPAAGAVSFAVIYAVTYHLVAAMVATTDLGGGEGGPSRWIVAAQTMLTGHGGSVEGSLAPAGTVVAPRISGFTLFATLIPPVVLVLAGYLFARSIRLEDRTDVGIAFGSLTVVYVAMAAVLATIATWTPEAESTARTGGAGTEGSEAVAVAVDAGFVLTTTGTLLSMVAVGAGVALLVRRLERPAPDSSDAAEG